MNKYNSPFLSTEGLTSTSANYIANLAKEYIQDIEDNLNSITLFTTSFKLINDSTSTTLVEGESEDFVNNISNSLDKITQAKSLIAWLREGIKAKDNYLKDISNLQFDEYLLLMDETLENPVMGTPLTEVEYYNSLPIKERNNYYNLETKCAVIGKYIHPNGAFSNARKELTSKMKKPVTITGVGRDAIVYTYTPTIDSSLIENTFFELQDAHRKAQAELNAIKHKCQLAIQKSNMDVTSKYKFEYSQFTSKKDKLFVDYKEYLEQERQKIASLKIVIPNNLSEIYQIVNSLGK